MHAGRCCQVKAIVALSHLALAEKRKPSRDGLHQSFFSYQQALWISMSKRCWARQAAHCLISSQLEVRCAHFCKIADMGVTIDLQNLGDAEACKEITVGIEHALSEKTGDWRVSIAGSHASESWEMRVEGPNGFERSYTLPGAAGQHVP